MDSFLEKVEAELARARKKHPRSINSAHEGYAVILEEIDEFWDLVKTDGPKDEMVAELIQVCAMCMRTVEDLKLQQQ